MLSQTGGHGDDWSICGGDVPFFLPHPGRPSGVVDGPDDVRRRVREIIRAGADVIKVATTGGVLSPRDDPRHAHFRDAEIAVMTEEATAAGLHVMAHAQGAGGIKAALRNGVRSIEHGIFLDDEAIEMMLQAGAWLVPTLHAPRAVIAAADAGLPIPRSVVDKARFVAEAHVDSVRRAHEAGVRIAMGTDCGVGPHGTNLDELDLMTQAGMSPLETLHATTGSAAELMDVATDRGTIRPGQRADLVVVDGEPDDVTKLGERVRAVYLDGAEVSRRAE
jgi:imidazolonepropionase-like amidohydrolase